MRLLEAILDANQRRASGAADARVPDDAASALPLAALTCIDPRLNRLFPDALGLAEEHFIWLRNAGNIVTGPVSSTMRSLALACAVKGAKEIAIIGHSDCQVCKTSTLQLLDRLAALGVDRHRLPENLVEYFGLFGSERQNVMRGVEFVRTSPLIGANVPVHGLLIDVHSGRLEWVVNGYETFARAAAAEATPAVPAAGQPFDRLGKIGRELAGELKLPTAKIGEIASTAKTWLDRAGQFASTVETEIASLPPPPVQTVTNAVQSAASAATDRLRLLARTVRPAKPAPPK